MYVDYTAPNLYSAPLPAPHTLPSPPPNLFLKTIFLPCIPSSSFFKTGHMAWHLGSSFPDQGLNLCRLQWKCGVLTTEPPGNSPKALPFIGDPLPTQSQGCTWGLLPSHCQEGCWGTNGKKQHQLLLPHPLPLFRSHCVFGEKQPPQSPSIPPIPSVPKWFLIFCPSHSPWMGFLQAARASSVLLAPLPAAARLA